VSNDSSYPRYEGSVYRPPSEADSLILQVMYGCSYGACTFCGMYANKRFRIRPFAEVKEDVENLGPAFKARIDRVFLADGDALALPVRSMLRILDLLATELSGLRRVSSYANAHSLLKHSEEELCTIRERGLEMLYLGVESGDDETLSQTRKGVSVTQTIEACRKAKRAGFRLSVMAILGLGGAQRSKEHARGTAEALSAIDPDYISLLTLMMVPGAPLAEQIERGEFVLPGPEESLRELRAIVAATEVTHAVFRTTHASNYVGIEGALPEDKPAMLKILDHVLAHGGQTWLRPESVRRL
jgi:radical SAM superfamily enzyme YgiQ (UPF0313 family)